MHNVPKVTAIREPLCSCHQDQFRIRMWIGDAKMDRYPVYLKDFTQCPGGRLISGGPDSGEAFREQVLRPAIRKYGVLLVDLDTGSPLTACADCFLEEAFGGLVRMLGADVLPALTFVCGGPGEDDVITARKYMWEAVDAWRLV
jgi:hypothetical protein